VKKSQLILTVLYYKRDEKDNVIYSCQLLLIICAILSL